MAQRNVLDFCEPENLDEGSQKKAVALDDCLDKPIDSKALEIEYIEHEVSKYATNGMAVTLTVKDSVLMTFKRRAIFIKVGELLHKSRNVERAILIPDWSNTGRLHFHGVITFKDITKILTVQKRATTEIGYLKVKGVFNTDKWAEYCVQQYKPDGKKGVKIAINHMVTIKK